MSHLPIQYYQWRENPQATNHCSMVSKEKKKKGRKKTQGYTTLKVSLDKKIHGEYKNWKQTTAKMTTQATKSFLGNCDWTFPGNDPRKERDILILNNKHNTKKKKKYWLWWQKLLFYIIAPQLPNKQSMMITHFRDRCFS